MVAAGPPAGTPQAEWMAQVQKRMTALKAATVQHQIEEAKKRVLGGGAATAAASGAGGPSAAAAIPAPARSRGDFQVDERRLSVTSTIDGDDDDDDDDDDELSGSDFDDDDDEEE